LQLGELARLRTAYFREYFYEFNAKSEAKDKPDNWADSSFKIRQKAPLPYINDPEIYEMVKKVLKE
jgi:hypothetical protein